MINHSSVRPVVLASIVLILSICLIVEAGNGILQVIGRVGHSHPLFRLTGHFGNPGPYGGFIAVLMAVCISFCVLARGGRLVSIVRWIAGIAAALGIIVLPATMSRSAWLGLAVAMLVLALRFAPVKKWIKSCRWALPLALVVLLGVGVGAFLLKKDSALGRLHIWRIESRIIAKNPLKGVGDGYFAYAYGMEQAEFFREKERSAYTKKVAGCPEYAFNEYIKAGVEHGIPGLLLSVFAAIACCIVLERRRNPLGYGCITLSMFACFSYPMCLWQFRILAGVFLAATVSEIIRERYGIAFSIITIAIVALVFLNERKPRKESFRDVYSQGYMLFRSGAYSEALPILERGSRMSSDPMFHNIMGRCHEALGEYDKAEEEYTLAHYMVPCRLYPLVLLQEMYLSQGDSLKAAEMMTAIRGVPVNPKNHNMTELRRRAENNQ